MTIHERASSRPRCFLTGSGISIAAFGIVRRGMRDGQDGDDYRVIALARYAEDDDVGAVLAALFESGAMFVMPEVCVIEDKTRLRMIVTRVHAGGGDRTDFIFGQIDGRETAPLRPETFEFFILGGNVRLTLERR